jgi:N-acetylglucosamine kinase-like BadF-type ATPase
VATQTGEVVGFGLSGPGNHEGVGYDGVTATILQSAGQALAQAGIGINQVSAAGFGIAGYDFPSERKHTLEAILPLGLQAPLEVVNDVVIGLIAGASEGWGIVVDAGTGNNVRGRDRAGREGWVTGCGVTFGEFGGGGDIVSRAVQVVSHHWSTRGPFTCLSEAFIKATGANSLTDLIEGLAQGYYNLDADAARLVFDVARQGDPIARQVVRWAACELGETTNAVIRQLSIQDEAFDIVLIGSVFKGGPLFTRPLQRTVHKYASKSRFTRLHVPPVTGAVLLGMEQIGLRDQEVRHRLFSSVSRVLEA